jgi:RNA polymerase sigma factor (sigma-70 family)
MTTATRPVARKQLPSVLAPSYVRHPSFNRPTAEDKYDADELLTAPTSFDDRYMPDEITRDHARRMHYAAHRIHAAPTGREARLWHGKYIALRDQIVLGNRKLIYQAVRRRMAVSNRTDDAIGDCHIVLIHAVAAYNPWLGIRFSTYAYTCLVRALARQSQRWSTDRLCRSISLDALPDGEPRGRGPGESSSVSAPRFDEFFRNDHPLLTDREKVILTRRFCLGERPGSPTLETVGAELGLSKERVRQVQASALCKLRKALLDPTSSYR